MNTEAPSTPRHRTGGRPLREATLVILTLPRVMIFLGTLALVAGLGLERRGLVLLGLGLWAMLILAWWRAPRLKRLRARRTHLGSTFEDETIRVELEVASEGVGRRPGTAWMVELRDTFPCGERSAIRAFLPTAFEGGRSVLLRYRPSITNKRGLYVLGPLDVAASDPLGLVERQVSMGLFTELLVYPRATMLDDFRPMHTHLIKHMGERSLPTPGMSQEFLHVREYQHGDSVRLVHWPASVRHGRLYVKTLEDNTMTEVTLVLDLYQMSHTGIGNVTSQEALIAAAASVATLAIERCHLVELFVVRQPAVHVPMGAGHQHLQEILRMLALTSSAGSGALAEGMKALGVRPRRGGSVVMVLAATSADDDAVAAIAQLVADGLRVAVVLIDDRTFTLLYLEQQLRASVHAPTEVVAARLAALGAEVTVVGRGDDLRHKLELVG